LKDCDTETWSVLFAPRSNLAHKQCATDHEGQSHCGRQLAIENDGEILTEAFTKDLDPVQVRLARSGSLIASVDQDQRTSNTKTPQRQTEMLAK